MPTPSIAETRCPFCRCAYLYAAAFERDIRIKHSDLTEIYFVKKDPESVLEEDVPVRYNVDLEINSDSGRIE